MHVRRIYLYAFNIFFTFGNLASEPATQLALFYVLNEVLQNCISYGAPEIKSTFKNPIMAALKSFR